MKLTEKDLKRFWNKIKINKKTGCWEWTAAKSLKGYGRFKLNGKLESPHIISYILRNGEYDRSLDVCHHCDNPSCVNPEHLFLGTRSENMLDSYKKGRSICRTPKGIKNPNSKLNPEKVKKIRKLINKNIILSKIAEDFNVHRSTINKIKFNEIWKDVL